MKFDQDFIEKVREASNLVDIIGQFVQLKRSSGGFTGLCPFHNEKSPSFSVSQEKQLYHCFGCKASGNVYSFLQNYQGMTFPESVEYLARRASIAIPENSNFSDSTRDHKSLLHRVNKVAAEFFHQELLMLDANHPVRQYCTKRGLSTEIIKAFQIGYAPEAWSDLSTYLEGKKAPMDAAEELGIVKRRTGGKSGRYDFFRNRLMFPIISTLGHCIGFGGRVFGDEQPKYLNSVDSLIFHKGKVFYGLNYSNKYIRSEDEVIVVEGYMDWLALVKAGVNNVVATLGTALTADHARVLKKYTQKVVVLFDGDNAGRTAAERSLPILLNEGLLPRGLFLPDELDPDEFLVERGVEELRRLITAAPDLFDLIARDLARAQKLTPTSKVQVLDKLAPILAQAKDSRLRQLYCQNLAEQLALDAKVVEQSVRAVLSPRAPSYYPSAGPQPGSSSASASGAQMGPATPANAALSTISSAISAPPAPQIELKGAPPQELDLLNVSLMKEVYLNEVITSGVMDQLAHPGVRRLMGRIVELYGQMPSKFDNLSALLVDEVKPFEMMTRFMSEPYASLTEDAAKKLIQDCVKRVRDKYFLAQSRELVSNLKGSQDQDRAAQLEQIMNIQKSRRSLNRDS